MTRNNDKTNAYYTRLTIEGNCNGLFRSRYMADKYRRRGEEVIVKVCGGYEIMSYADYAVWRNQK